MAFHLFHGSEAYLVELAFNRVWTGLTRDLDSDLDCEMLDSSATPDDVLVACTSVGFFSPIRVVGVRERLGRHPARGDVWRDVVLIERRSPVVT